MTTLIAKKWIPDLTRVANHIPRVGIACIMSGGLLATVPFTGQYRLQMQLVVVAVVVGDVVVAIVAAVVAPVVAPVIVPVVAAVCIAVCKVIGVVPK